MTKIFSLLVILGIIFIIGCNKEETTEKITGAYQIEEVQTAEDVKEEAVEEERKNTTTVRLCHDTDNGVVRWVKGSVFGFYSNATRFEFNDYCQNNNYLMEFYCEDEYPDQPSFHKTSFR